MSKYDVVFPVSTDVISFTTVALPYGWLGNMSAHTVYYDDKEFRTTEALFQYLRFAGMPEVQEAIWSAKSPMAAKMVAKKHKALLVGVTEERGPEDLDRMRLCLQLKVKDHKWMRQSLKGTGNSVLVEDVSKRKGGSGMFWGCAWSETEKAWKGENWLGRLWMEVRSGL
jgi:ribA/ribD-fused uncharacterized protein